MSPAAVRLWVRTGAPCIKRTRPLLVDVEALRRWRDSQHADIAGQLGVALLDVLRRDCGVGVPAHMQLGIPASKAAALLVVAFDRAHAVLVGPEAVRPLPECVRQLRTIAGATPDPE